MIPFILMLQLGSALASASAPKIHTQTVEYKQGDTVLEGYLAYSELSARTESLKPGVIVIHDWLGVGPYAKKRAEMLAELGFIAFAADIYGKGVHADNPEQAGKLAGKYKADRALLRLRARAALDYLRTVKMVDPRKIAAIGYCFGGGTALELARSGAPIVGVVSFHGFLDTPNPTDIKSFHGKILALHGANDPVVPEKDVSAFEAEMRNAKADWEFVAYGGAVHGFTNPDSGNDPSKPVAYNAEADARSWDEMKRFFKEIF